MCLFEQMFRKSNLLQLYWVHLSEVLFIFHQWNHSLLKMLILSMEY